MLEQKEGWRVVDEEGAVTVIRPDGTKACYGGMPAILLDDELPDDVREQVVQLQQEVSAATNIGFLAKKFEGIELPLLVLESAAGFYIGTFDQKEGPITRESVEYFPTREAAENALIFRDWTQRDNP
jgi:hypothetical protein